VFLSVLAVGRGSFRFRFQEKRAVHDGFTGAHTDSISTSPTSRPRPRVDLEVRVSFGMNTHQRSRMRCGRAGSRPGALIANWQPGRPGYARTKEPFPIREVNADGDGPRVGVDALRNHGDCSRNMRSGGPQT
jgi:hypothetical protein